MRLVDHRHQGMELCISDLEWEELNRSFHGQFYADIWQVLCKSLSYAGKRYCMQTRSLFCTFGEMCVCVCVCVCVCLIVPLYAFWFVCTFNASLVVAPCWLVTWITSFPRLNLSLPLPCPLLHVLRHLPVNSTFLM